MMSLTFGLFNQVSGLGPLGPLVLFWANLKKNEFAPREANSFSQEIIPFSKG